MYIQHFLFSLKAEGEENPRGGKCWGPHQPALTAPHTHPDGGCTHSYAHRGHATGLAWTRELGRGAKQRRAGNQSETTPRLLGNGAKGKTGEGRRRSAKSTARRERGGPMAARPPGHRNDRSGRKAQRDRSAGEYGGQTERPQGHGGARAASPTV